MASEYSDQFIQNWSEKQKPFHSTPSYVSILKDHYVYSNYLDKMHNQETRIVFVRLRLGHSILNASMGRFKNKKLLNIYYLCVRILIIFEKVL